MSAAAVIAMRRKRLIRRFRELGALDEKRAVTFDSLSQRQSWIFEQMVNQRVFLQTTDGRFYLDERAAEAFMRKHKMRAIYGTLLILLIFFLGWALVALFRGN